MLNLAIGQGENSQTVLNMARFYTALATDGTAPTPRSSGASRSARRSCKLDRRADRRAAQGARSAWCRGRHGRGVGDQGRAARRQDGHRADRTLDAIGKELNHAWFVGFAPADDPKIVVVVMIEFGGHGTRAAHIASKIISHYLQGRRQSSTIETPADAQRAINVDCRWSSSRSLLSLYGIAIVYSAGQTDVPTAVARA